MNKATVLKILKTAEKLDVEGKRWHFHILTPGCVFNKDKRFALILENTTDNEQLIHFSLKKPLETGKKLVEILHGKGISKNKKVSSKGERKENLTQNVKQMIKIAIELNLKGFSWHHHLLFPDCIFNKDSRYWTLVFENPLENEVIEERFKEEPIEALSQIEPLYYKQK